MADSSDAPAPRLCHLIKWPDFDGYGFNLHGEKSKPGQYIGKVDPDSPAELAGLKLNDRIIEVNGTNIANENHKQVVLRIKAIPNETKLLVLNDKEEQYYKSLNIVVHGDMPNVVYMKTPVPRPSNRNNVTTATVVTATTHEDNTASSTEVDSSPLETTKAEIIPRSQSRHSSNDESEDKGDHLSENGSASPITGNASSLGEKHSRSSFSVDDDASSNGLSPTPPRISASPSPSPTLSHGNGRSGSLDFNMTAQEMRAKLAAQRKHKHEAKNAKIDVRKKYDIIQTL